MRTVPRGLADRIGFYESHVPSWVENAAEIGLGPVAVHEFETLVEEARAAHLAAERAREAAKAATLVFHERAEAMGAAGAGLIRSIRAFAETTGDHDVYAQAHLPAPRTPAPLGPPGCPHSLAVTLEATGALGLHWSCDNPEGSQNTVYEIARRIGDSTHPFTYLGITGDRSFVDDTLPPGAAAGAAGAAGTGAGAAGRVVYQITALRSTRRGEPARFVVNFGVEKPGAEKLGHSPIDALGGGYEKPGQGPGAGNQSPESSGFTDRPILGPRIASHALMSS